VTSPRPFLPLAVAGTLVVVMAIVSSLQPGAGPADNTVPGFEVVAVFFSMGMALGYSLFVLGRRRGDIE